MLKLILIAAMLQGYHAPSANYECTAYCPCLKCNGNSLQVAKNGDHLIPNYHMAVDPGVLPFGSIVYIKSVGIRKAVDTGAFSGNRIDVLFSTHDEALEFGRKDLKVCKLLLP